MNTILQKQKGFTIVELLIVIVVIAILAAISIVAYTGVQENARNTQRAADAKTVADAINAYYAQNSTWPGTGATDAADFAGDVESALNGFQIVKVGTSVTDRITDEVPDSANPARIRVVVRGTWAAPTGVVVHYFKSPSTVLTYETGS